MKIDDPGGNIQTEKGHTEVLKSLPVYRSLRSCLEKEKLDAVHICVHTDLHYNLAKEALQCNLHVLIEKPFVLSLEKGKELIKLAAEKKKILMVAHVVRFMSPYIKLKEMIDSECYGKMNFLENEFA